MILNVYMHRVAIDYPIYNFNNASTQTFSGCERQRGAHKRKGKERPR